MSEHQQPSVLVTGGAGYIGTELIFELSGQPSTPESTTAAPAFDLRSALIGGSALALAILLVGYWWLQHRPLPAPTTVGDGRAGGVAAEAGQREPARRGAPRRLAAPVLRPGRRDGRPCLGAGRGGVLRLPVL